VYCSVLLCIACRYAHGRFDLDNAIGPFRLDLGDVLYAPNVMRDDHGRVVMWGWLQEKRSVSVCKQPSKRSWPLDSLWPSHLWMCVNWVLAAVTGVMS
jgi:hypothetical protein